MTDPDIAQDCSICCLGCRRHVHSWRSGCIDDLRLVPLSEIVTTAIDPGVSHASIKRHRSHSVVEASRKPGRLEICHSESPSKLPALSVSATRATFDQASSNIVNGTLLAANVERIRSNSSASHVVPS